MSLFCAAAQRRLCEECPDYRIICRDTVDSTMNECERLEKRHQGPGNILVLADAQTQGRGRYGRNWESARGVNLYMSFTLDNPLPGKIGHLNLLFGILVYRTVAGLYGDFGSRLTAKWPNDIYIADKKLAGILFQSIDPHCNRIIAGIGINVHATTEMIPNTATSLAIERVIERTSEARLDLIVSLLKSLHGPEVRDFAAMPHLVLQDFARCAQRTRDYGYSYTSSHYKHRGRLLKIHEDGTVDIETDSGTVTLVT